MYVKFGRLCANTPPPCFIRVPAEALALVAIYSPFAIFRDTADSITPSPAEGLVFASVRIGSAILFSAPGSDSPERNLGTRGERRQRSRATTSPHGEGIGSSVRIPPESQ